MIPITQLNKTDKLYLYSNPHEVQQKANKFLGNGITIYKSTKPNKKYMVFDGAKYIHFGQMGYEDATHHKNKIRINNFKKRNKSWNTYPKYSPAWLSYNLLW